MTEDWAFRVPSDACRFAYRQLDLPHMGAGGIGRLVPQLSRPYPGTGQVITRHTELADGPHVQCHDSENLRSQTTDRTDFHTGPGDLSRPRSAFDAWGVGGESDAVVGWSGASGRAR
jgi:hypothetical protein